MDFIKNNVKLIDLATPGKKIEYAGRVCYKSYNTMTEDSYKIFIPKIASSGHTSVLEHEHKMFRFKKEFFSKELEDLIKYNGHFKITCVNNDTYYISANIRAWYELVNKNRGNAIDIISSYLSRDYPYLFEHKTDEIDIEILYGAEAEEYCPIDIHKIYTFEIVGSRSFTHQLVRHRTLSFSQESQRYVNFSKDKFGHSVKFMDFDFEEPERKKFYVEACQKTEELYFKMIEAGCKPEDARQVLPNGTATTIIASGTKEEWKMFLKLRLDPHAQSEIRSVAETIASYLHVTKTELGIE